MLFIHCAFHDCTVVFSGDWNAVGTPLLFTTLHQLIDVTRDLAIDLLQLDYGITQIIFI